MRVESGTVSAGPEMPNWDLDSGSGLRTCTYRARFRDEFADAPTVSASLSGLDVVSVGSRVAIQTDIVAVDTSGFDVMFSTRDDQQIKQVILNWIAVGS